MALPSTVYLLSLRFGHSNNSDSEVGKENYLLKQREKVNRNAKRS